MNLLATKETDTDCVSVKFKLTESSLATYETSLLSGKLPKKLIKLLKEYGVIKKNRFSFRAHNF